MLTQLIGAVWAPPTLGVQLPQSPPPEIDNQFEEAGGQNPDTATKHTPTSLPRLTLKVTIKLEEGAKSEEPILGQDYQESQMRPDS